MVAPHGWRECRPGILSLEGADPAETARMDEAVEKVWATLSGADRQAFHRFCCLNRRGADEVVAGRISMLVQAELEGQR